MYNWKKKIKRQRKCSLHFYCLEEIMESQHSFFLKYFVEFTNKTIWAWLKKTKKQKRQKTKRHDLNRSQVRTQGGIRLWLPSRTPLDTSLCLEASDVFVLWAKVPVGGYGKGERVTLRWALVGVGSGLEEMPAAQVSVVLNAPNFIGETEAQSSFINAESSPQLS